MKKSNFKIFFATLLIFISFCSCGISGKDPGKLLRKAGLKIDNYEIIYQKDNLIRESSAWDNFEYFLKVEEYNAELKNQLEKLISQNDHWVRVNGGYEYDQEEDGDYELSISVSLEHSTIEIHYLKYNIFF